MMKVVKWYLVFWIGFVGSLWSRNVPDGIIVQVEEGTQAVRVERWNETVGAWEWKGSAYLKGLKGGELTWISIDGYTKINPEDQFRAWALKGDPAVVPSNDAVERSGVDYFDDYSPADSEPEIGTGNLNRVGPYLWRTRGSLGVLFNPGKSLVFYQLTDAQGPQWISELAVEGTVNDLYVLNDFIILKSHDHFRVISIENPKSPFVVDEYSWEETVLDSVQFEGRIYVLFRSRDLDNPDTVLMELVVLSLDEFGRMSEDSRIELGVFDDYEHKDIHEEVKSEGFFKIVNGDLLTFILTSTAQYHEIPNGRIIGYGPRGEPQRASLYLFAGYIVSTNGSHFRIGSGGVPELRNQFYLSSEASSKELIDVNDEGTVFFGYSRSDLSAGSPFVEVKKSLLEAFFLGDPLEVKGEGVEIGGYKETPLKIMVTDNVLIHIQLGGIKTYDISDLNALKLLDSKTLNWESSLKYPTERILLSNDKHLLLVPYENGPSQNEQGLKVYRNEEGALIELFDLNIDIKNSAVSFLDNERLLYIFNGQLKVFSLVANDGGPLLLSEEEISLNSWNVSRVFDADDYLIQLDNGEFSDDSRPALRVTTKEEPDVMLYKFELPRGELVGTELREGYLYLLYENGIGQNTPEGLAMLVVDCRNPLSIMQLGVVDNLTQINAHWESFQPHWLDANTLVWALEGGSERIIGIAISLEDRWNPVVLDVEVLDVAETEYDQVEGLSFTQDTAFYFGRRIVDTSWELPDGTVLKSFMLNDQILRLNMTLPDDLRFEAGPHIMGGLLAVKNDPLGTIYITKKYTYFDDGLHLMLLNDHNITARTYAQDMWVQVWYSSDTLFQYIPEERMSGKITVYGNSIFGLSEQRIFKANGNELKELKAKGKSLFVMTDMEMRYWPDSDVPENSYGVATNSSLTFRANEDLLILDGEIWRTKGYFGLDHWKLEGIPQVEEVEYPIVQTEGTWEAVDIITDEKVKAKIKPMIDHNHAGYVRQYWVSQSASFRNPDNESYHWGDGWFQSSWFGWYHGGEQGTWIWHLDHGWNYAQGTGNGSYQYDKELGWYYAGASIYPFIYAYSPAGWLYYLKETGPTGTRWFYDYRGGKNDWISMPRSGL